MTQKVRCKFKVDTLVTTKTDSGYKATELKMSPVFSDDPNSENKQYWDATPSGGLTINVTNDSLDHLNPTKEYYLDLIPVE